MKNKIAYLFPGQGSQFIGMGKDLYDNTSIAKEYYDQADNFFNFSLSKISFEGPNDLLRETIYTQPAIYVNSCIISKILTNKGILPNAVAGHSLGELSALFSSNAISFIDGLEIVKVRSKAMYLSGKKKPGKMAAFIGPNEKQVQEFCNQNEIVVPANINSKDQIVISGTIPGVESAIKSAKKNGFKKIFSLNVSGAFHSPLMEEAKQVLNDLMKKINFNNTTIPVFQNINAQPETNGKKLKTNFLNQLTNSVRWYDTIENIIKNNIYNFIELGPGNVLQRLNRRINKKTVNFGTDNYKKIIALNYEI